jgi:hypothetical protein
MLVDAGRCWSMLVDAGRCWSMLVDAVMCGWSLREEVDEVKFKS